MGKKIILSSFIFLASSIAMLTSCNVKKSYTVTFDTDGGTAIEKQTVYENELVKKPTNNPTKDRNEFVDWYIDSDKTIKFDFSSFKINSDTTIFAKYRQSECLVTVYTRPNQTPSRITVSSGSKLKEITPEPWEGHNFLGFYTDSTYKTKYNFDHYVTSDITLYGKWDAIKFTTTFKPGIGLNEFTQVVEYGNKIVKPKDPVEEKAGNFIGWYLDEDFKKPYNFDNEVYHDITLYGKWNITKNYDVNFYSLGVVIQTQQIPYYSKARNFTPAGSEGFAFAGWYEDEECSGKPYNFSTPIVENKNLYAKWVQNKYVVAFVYDSKYEYVDYQLVDMTGEAKATKPEDPTYEGYDFKYWYLNDETVEFNFDTPITDNTVLHAKWDIQKFTVTFNCNGGSEIEPLIDVEYGSLITKPTDPIREGSSFVGWYKDEALKEPFNFEIEKIKSNITLHAKWTIYPFHIEITGNTGSLFNNYHNLDISNGNTFNCAAKLDDSGKALTMIDWSINCLDTDIAEISEDGLLTIKKPEEANCIGEYGFQLTVTATSKFDSETKVELPVNVGSYSKLEFKKLYDEEYEYNCYSVCAPGESKEDHAKLNGDIIIPYYIYDETDKDDLYVKYFTNKTTSKGTLGAFEGCSIENVSIGKFIHKIEDNAFKECKSLKSVHQFLGHSNLCYIGNSAFEDCVALQEIYLPSKLTEYSAGKIACLGDNCFKNCDALETIYLKSQCINDNINQSEITRTGLFTVCNTCWLPEDMFNTGGGTYLYDNFRATGEKYIAKEYGVDVTYIQVEKN